MFDSAMTDNEKRNEVRRVYRETPCGQETMPSGKVRGYREHHDASRAKFVELFGRDPERGEWERLVSNAFTGKRIRDNW